MRRTEDVRRLWRGLASIRLTIACLSLLMVLVVLCTLAQVQMGTFGAVKLYIRDFFLYWTVPGTALKVPVFPAGGAVGLTLFANLTASTFQRWDLSWRKAGLLLSHLGILLLIVGEFTTGAFQVETQMAIEEGQTRRHVEDGRRAELALIDVTSPTEDHVVSVPESLLAQRARIELPASPFTLLVKRFYANSSLAMSGAGDGVSLATTGVGTRVTAHEEPPVSADDQVNTVSGYVEVLAKDRSLGTWLLSGGLGAPQSFLHEGRTYHLSIRPRRFYLPYTITLKDFRHDVYAGTDIPKNFSSLVTLSDPERGEERDVLISMNHPLRYRGKSYYQASFGKGDTLSVLQVVENPGRLVPYVSCLMVFVGLLWHFGVSLAFFRAGRSR